MRRGPGVGADVDRRHVAELHVAQRVGLRLRLGLRLGIEPRGVGVVPGVVVDGLVRTRRRSRSPRARGQPGAAAACGKREVGEEPRPRTKQAEDDSPHRSHGAFTLALQHRPCSMAWKLAPAGSSVAHPAGELGVFFVDSAVVRGPGEVVAPAPHRDTEASPSAGRRRDDVHAVVAPADALEVATWKDPPVSSRKCPPCPPLASTPRAARRNRASRPASAPSWGSSCADEDEVRLRVRRVRERTCTAGGTALKRAATLTNSGVRRCRR